MDANVFHQYSLSVYRNVEQGVITHKAFFLILNFEAKRTNCESIASGYFVCMPSLLRGSLLGTTLLRGWPTCLQGPCRGWPGPWDAWRTLQSSSPWGGAEEGGGDVSVQGMQTNAAELIGVQCRHNTHKLDVKFSPQVLNQLWTAL